MLVYSSLTDKSCPKTYAVWDEKQIPVLMQTLPKLSDLIQSSSCWKVCVWKLIIKSLWTFSPPKQCSYLALKWAPKQYLPSTISFAQISEDQGIFMPAVSVHFLTALLNICTSINPSPKPDRLVCSSIVSYGQSFLSATKRSVLSICAYLLLAGTLRRCRMPLSSPANSVSPAKAQHVRPASETKKYSAMPAIAIPRPQSHIIQSMSSCISVNTLSLAGGGSLHCQWQTSVQQAIEVSVGALVTFNGMQMSLLTCVVQREGSLSPSSEVCSC